jgi:hypothetical protein
MLEQETELRVIISYTPHGIRTTPTNSDWVGRHCSHYPPYIQEIFAGFYGDISAKHMAMILSMGVKFEIKRPLHDQLRKGHGYKPKFSTGNVGEPPSTP